MPNTPSPADASAASPANTLPTRGAPREDETRVLRRLLAAQDQDRQLLAYEIHDGLVQDITAAGMFLEMVELNLAENPAEARARLAQASELVKKGVREARRLMGGLRHPVLEQEGLVAALEQLVAETRMRTGMEIVFRHPERLGRLAPGLELALYRAAQEALTNAWKHGDADDAAIDCERVDDQVRLRVRDTGKGFDVSQVKQGRHGLEGMRERARLLGGTCRIESAPGQGALVEVTYPALEADAPPGAPPDSPS